MRREVRIIGWIGVVCSVSLMVALSAVLISHPRDEQGYVAYVARFRSYGQEPRGALPPRMTLVAAGDRACTWLDRQPPALWRAGRSWQVDSLVRRYKHTTSAEDESLPLSVVPGAWAYLCPGSFYLRKPHDVFRNRDD